MRLGIFNSKLLTIFTLCLFIFLLTSEASSLRGFQEAESFAKLLGEGEAFYKNKEYDKAIIRYLEAYMQAEKDSEKSDVYMGLALAHTANNQKDKAQDYLLKILKMQPDKKIDEQKYPADFVILFYRAKIEALKPVTELVKTVPTEVVEQEEKKVPPKTEAAKKQEPKKEEPKPATVEKKTTTPAPAKKTEPQTVTKTEPKKEPAKEEKAGDLPDKLKDVPGVTATKKEDVAKKEKQPATKEEKTATKDETKEPVVKQQVTQEGRIEEKKKIPWLLIAGVAVIGGALAYLLLGGSESSEEEVSAGSIQVNSSPSGAQIFLDGSDTGQVTNATLTGIAPGTHEVEVTKEAYVDYKETVSVTSGQTARVDATLSKHTISVSSPKANDVWHKGQNVQIKWNTGGGSSAVKSATQSHFNQLISDGGNNRAFLRLKVYRERETMRARSHSLRAGGGGVEDSSDELAGVRKVIGELSQPTRERTPGATGQPLDGNDNPGNNPGMLNIISKTQPGNDKAVPAGDLGVQTVSEVKIELLQDGKRVKTIATRTQNDGQHNWKVPADVPEGFNFKVKVSAADELSVSGTSKVFTVIGEYELSMKWGSKGNAQDQFNQPYGIAVGNSKVYIVEDINSRISIYTQQGTFLNMWGSPGKGSDQFQGPLGVAVANNGNIYVADTNNERIMVFKPDGTFVREWGKRGGGNAKFRSPTGIAVDKNDNVYVADSYNFRIQKFDAAGKFLAQWGSRGSGNDQFGLPVGVTVDNSGNVYVVDSENHRVMKFSSNGQFITKWGSQGSGDDRFNHPVGVACDSYGNVYVTDSENHRFMKFDSTGKLITKLGTRGDGDDQFRYPSGIAVDASGRVYISDSGNYRIMKFKFME